MLEEYSNVVSLESWMPPVLPNRTPEKTKVVTRVLPPLNKKHSPHLFFRKLSN